MRDMLVIKVIEEKNVFQPKKIILSIFRKDNNKVKMIFSTPVNVKENVIEYVNQLKKIATYFNTRHNIVQVKTITEVEKNYLNNLVQQGHLSIKGGI